MSYYQLGDPISTDGWCDSCNLPAVARFPIYELSEDGVSEFGTIDKCYECWERNRQHD